MIELYPDYQVPAFKKLVSHFKNNAIGLMVMATGLGKTIVAAFWAKREYKKDRKGLFLCHDTGILDQAQDEFRKVMGNTVSIKTFYGNDKDWSADEGDVVFATFQTLTKTNPFFADEFDFIVVDESHHGQAPTYKDVIQYFTPKKLLGITATPDREDMQDIREIFGDEAVNISLEEGIANGWLSQVEYHILNDHLSHWKLKKIVKDVLEDGKRISLKQLNETIFVKARDNKTANIIQDYSQGGKKAIIFCESIPHAENFVKFLPNAAVYHSEKTENHNPKHNRKILQDFRDGNIQHILAVNMMNEGVDIPDAEIIVFLRCTDSKTIFFQQLGRGLRKLLRKKKVIVLDFVANCERVAVVKDFADKIKSKFPKPENLMEDVLRVSGKAFDFIFSDEQIKILEVIKKIKSSRKFISDIPHLFAEYSQENELPADQVVAGTNKKLLWICSTCEHEWQAIGNSRARGSGCPACTNQVVTEKNNLSVTYPDLAKEYSSKNDLPADQVIASTGAQLWWKCLKCGYEWQTTGYSRANQGTGCLSCLGRIPTKDINLMITHPELAKEYSPKNDLPADQVLAGTHEKLLWICSTCEYEWLAVGDSRVRGSGCPACAGMVVTHKNNLSVTHPELAKEYSPKNDLPADQVLATTMKKLWWICVKCEHEWHTTGDNRARGGTGCPACAGKVVTHKNNLAVKYPEIAREYSSKNILSANEVHFGTHKKFLWNCLTCEHEWTTSCDSRVRSKSGCPACAGRVVTEKNNLSVTHHELAKEYSLRNDLPVNKVVAGTGKKLWWTCSVCGHEWQAPGSRRVGGSGCIECYRNNIKKKS